MRLLYYSILFVSFVFYSCDKCKDVDCNYGDCVKGDCNCYDYYEGSFCDVEMREKFYGRYDGTLKYEGKSEQVYTILEKAGDEVSKIDWDNVGFLLITGSTEFTIPEQVVTFDDELYVLRGEGGTLDYHKLTIKYSVGYQGYTVYYEFVGFPHVYKKEQEGINLKEIIWDSGLQESVNYIAK